MQVTFKASKKDLTKAFSIVKVRSKQIKSDSLLRISILPDAVEFFNHGVSHKIAAETEGLADVSLPDHLLSAYISTSPLPIISFTIRPGELLCGSSIYKSPAITVDAFMSTKESPLPVNADDFTILRYCYRKDVKWLEDHYLMDTYILAQSRLNSNLKKAIECLAPYKIKVEDLKKIINERIDENS